MQAIDVFRPVACSPFHANGGLHGGLPEQGPLSGRLGLIRERAKGGNGLAIPGAAPHFGAMTEALRLDRALFAVSGPETTDFPAESGDE